MIVSIHAPVMDAKMGRKVQQIPNMVSIHAPVMDAKRWSATRNL